MRPGAQRVLLGAIALGGLTQALFWDVHAGLGWLALDLVLVGAQLVVFARGPDGRMRAPLAGVIGSAASLFFGVALVWRASDWTLAVALPANVACLSALPLLLRGDVRFDFGELVRAIFSSLFRVPKAALECARLPSRALRPLTGSSGGSIVRGLVIGLPMTLVFTLLLSADPSFHAAISTGFGHVSALVRFGLLSLLGAAGYALLYFVHGSGAERTHGNSLPQLGPYRCPAGEAEVAPSFFSVRPGTWKVVLAQPVVVFALYGAANARVLFAGHAFARARGTVTYAEHLHAGFVQVSIAAFLAVAMVIAGHRLLSTGHVGTRSVCGGKVLVVLETALLVLSGVALASCAYRLSIYQVAYGATYLRLAVAAFQLAAFVLLALTTAKCVARAWQGWSAAVSLSWLALALGAAWFDADGTIARTNLDRAQAVRSGSVDPMAWGVLDVDYLARLSSDARPLLAHPAVLADPELFARLDAAWCEGAARDWREFRGARSTRSACRAPLPAPADTSPPAALREEQEGDGEGGRGARGARPGNVHHATTARHE